MKDQYILLATAFIILFLFLSLIYYQSSPVSYINSEFIGKNFENEIYYISDKFSKYDIGNYIYLFENYTEQIGYNFSFICLSPINISLPSCSSQNINCCYYYNFSFYFNQSILIFCNSSGYLYSYEDLICFCYDVNKSNEFYINFFCT